MPYKVMICYVRKALREFVYVEGEKKEKKEEEEEGEIYVYIKP